jgi:4-hydroxy-tetrahydrodipicolinate synthase
MMSSESLRGIWSAALTPVGEDLWPDTETAIGYYRDLLENGCDGLNLLGTTGEAMSFGVKQRLRFIDAIAESGLPMQRVMFGTGASALHDAVRLMRAAFGAQAAAALVMPPFFFRDAGDDGIVAFFDALLARAYVEGKRVLLYNFPRMSGITFHADLVDRLVNEFPGVIAGMKDSSNDRTLQKTVLERQPELTVFPGSEEYLVEAKAYGAAGCISGSVALWPRLAREVFETGDSDAAQRLAKLRQSLSGMPLVPTVRYLVARSRGDAAWERAMPPLQALSPEDREKVDAARNDSTLHV